MKTGVNGPGLCRSLGSFSFKAHCRYDIMNQKNVDILYLPMHIWRCSSLLEGLHEVDKRVLIQRNIIQPIEKVLILIKILWSTEFSNKKNYKFLFLPTKITKCLYTLVYLFFVVVAVFFSMSRHIFKLESKRSVFFPKLTSHCNNIYLQTCFQKLANLKIHMKYVY